MSEEVCSVNCNVDDVLVKWKREFKMLYNKTVNECCDLEFDRNIEIWLSNI